MNSSGSSQYKFRCTLKKFSPGADNFSCDLDVTNAAKFCLSLEEKTNLAVKYIRPTTGGKRPRAHDSKEEPNKKTARLDDDIPPDSNER